MNAAHLNQPEFPQGMPPAGSVEVPDYPPDFSTMGPAMPEGNYEQQIPVAPVAEAVPDSPATQSFGERMKGRAEHVVAVAKRLGAAAIESVISIDRDDRAGIAPDAHEPYADRFVSRTGQSESLSAAETGREDRAGMSAKRIIKGAGYAVKAYGVYKTVKPLLKHIR